MLVANLLLLASSVLPGQVPQGGVISGTVMNLTEGKKSPCRAQVVLQIFAEGQFVPFRETVSDAEGKFHFAGLPMGSGYRYQAGANRHGVHYPGPRLQLTAAQPRNDVELKVYDAVTGPNPLVIRQYDVTLVPEAGALRVTESIILPPPATSAMRRQTAVSPSRCNSAFPPTSSARPFKRSSTAAGST
jgi:hypothetical protein